MPLYSRQRLFIGIVNFGIHSFKPMCFGKWLCCAKLEASNYRNLYKQVSLFNAFAAAKWQSERAENGIANQDHFDLQFSIRHPRAGAGAGVAAAAGEV